jgi:hypothetical protein
MTLLLKDPGAMLDYSVDWGRDYLDGDVLAQSSWTVSPTEPGGIVVAASQYDLLIATVEVSGGKPGTLYRLVNEVVTASGREDRRSIVLRVEQR